MPEPLDLNTLPKFRKGDLVKQEHKDSWNALIAELRATREERDVAYSDLDHERSYLRSALDRAEQAEAAIARVRAICLNPPVPSRMLIPIVIAALDGTDERPKLEPEYRRHWGFR